MPSARRFPPPWIIEEHADGVSSVWGGHMIKTEIISDSILRITAPAGEVLGLLENWRGASFADVNQQTGFGEPGKGAPHGNENTGFAAHP